MSTVLSVFYGGVQHGRGTRVKSGARNAQREAGTIAANMITVTDCLFGCLEMS